MRILAANYAKDANAVQGIFSDHLSHVLKEMVALMAVLYELFSLRYFACFAAKKVYQS